MAALCSFGFLVTECKGHINRKIKALKALEVKRFLVLVTAMKTKGKESKCLIVSVPTGIFKLGVRTAMGFS